MAFSETQKAQIRRYLGYASIFRYKNTRLESVLDSLDAAVETLIIADIAQVVAVEAAITTSLSTGGAGELKKVDEVEFYQSKSGDSLSRLRSLGRVYVGRISITLGVPINADFFSGQGWPGDLYSSLGQMGNGGGFGGYEVG